MVTDSACDSLENTHHTALHCFFHYLHITRKIAEKAWASLWNISVPTSRTTSLLPALQYPCRPNAIISLSPSPSLCRFFPSQGCRERNEAILECLVTLSSLWNEIFRILPSFLWRQQYIMASMPPSQIRCWCCNIDSKYGWVADAYRFQSKQGLIFPPLLLFCTRLICKDTTRRDYSVSGVCLSTQKCFRKTLKFTVPVSSERGLQRRNSLLCRTLYCDISTLSHSLPTAGSTRCQLNTLKQGLPTACCAAATEIQSNRESLPGLVFKETIIFEAMLFHWYTKQILRITTVPC